MRAAIVAALGLAFCITAMSPASAESLRFSLSARTDWPSSGYDAYCPVRIEITNRGAAVDGELVLSSAHGSDHSLFFTRRVALAGGGMTAVELPLMCVGWAEVELRVGGRRVAESYVNLPGSTPEGRGRYGPAHSWRRRYQTNRAVLAISHTNHDLDHLTAGGKAALGSYAEISAATVRPEYAPRDWQSYSSLALCISSPAALDALDGAQRQALARWVLSGGRLLMEDAPGDSGTSTLTLLGLESWRIGEERHGPDMPWDSAVDVGLGTVFISGRSTLPGLASEWERSFKGRVSSSVQNAIEKAVSERFNIPGVDDPPVAFFIVISLTFIFAITVGNWMLVRRLFKSQTMFVLTTPVIAAVTSVLLLGGKMAQEGVKDRARVETLTVLNLAEKRGLTWSRYAFFSPFPQPGGLKFDTSTLVLPVEVPLRRQTVNWGDGQSFGGGFLPSRSYCSYVTCSQFAERARVTITRRGDGYVLTNGLSVDLEDVRVNVDGEIVRFVSVRAGSEAEGLRSSGRPPTPAEYFGDVFGALAAIKSIPAGAMVGRLAAPLGSDVGLRSFEDAKGSHYLIALGLEVTR